MHCTKTMAACAKKTTRPPIFHGFRPQRASASPREGPIPTSQTITACVYFWNLRLLSDRTRSFWARGAGKRADKKTGERLRGARGPTGESRFEAARAPLPRDSSPARVAPVGNGQSLGTDPVPHHFQTKRNKYTKLAVRGEARAESFGWLVSWLVGWLVSWLGG